MQPQSPAGQPPHAAPPKEVLDIAEKGAPRAGVRQSLDKRLFVQLSVFTGSRDADALSKALAAAKFQGVLYADVNDPTGVGLVSFSEDPEYFATELRKLAGSAPFGALTLRPEFAMLGRTYALGYEPDLEDWLIKRPRRVMCSPENKWAVWYPLRRTGSFAKLPREEQMQILKEHGNIGRQFGEAGFAEDMRLACHGLDAHDNDFVIGLIGKSLHPLSACVEAMRKTRQTSEFIANLGPFFVGRAVWQTPL